MKTVVLTVVTLLAGLVTGPAAATEPPRAVPAAAPSPLVTGPIPATAPPGDPSHGYPFFATDQNLRARGYVEEEYFVEGTANRYTTPDGATGSVIDGGHEYRTRIVVRRPVSPRKFNGTAVVEWYNVTNTFDYEVVWSRSFRHLLDAGYAWVGVSAQAAGVHSGQGLKAWSPHRYGTLDLTDGGTVTDDSLSYDVFSQVAQALRHPRGANPLPGLKVETLIATGQSQSASRLTTYANSVHPIAPVYDAIAIVDGGVGVRTDLTTKVFKTASEYDVLANQAARRQPDTDRFVSWEIAGASHSDRHAYLVNNPIRLRDAGVSGLLAGPTAPCVAPARSNVPYEYVLDAMFDHIVRWTGDGVRPPAGPRIEVTDTGTRPATANRDAYQIVKGGIRLAAVAVPTERNTGWNTGLTPDRDSACAQGGTWIPFDGTTLRGLYPTHTSYVDAVRRVTAQNLRDGYLTREDADATVRAAEKADVP
ncbi:alpha/beta hydrolase domain-containing protein [Amycolatopsis sp. DG1A-15b]|uniref:alpha/beta hydrolase domain-containing protein n=1 Tax=Amycolatopsis sp. DG1A-15b TaxID=3052846 RepID=UPI00255B8D75|nr:alpha/beta hydrolase domain-containing protein [Amycolatopsis sp. DG1A-15b]WIX92383.1 alpha/beta hydrolase domain-containing protein [Amycolatopsis sp. DG1A-15b]